MKTSKNDLPAFTSADICAIIKECGLSGVRALNFRGLELRYGPLPTAQAIEPIHVPHEIQTLTDSQAREAIGQREQEIKQNLLDQMLVEDPEGYEELLKNEELVDEEIDGP